MLLGRQCSFYPWHNAMAHHDTTVCLAYFLWWCSHQVLVATNRLDGTFFNLPLDDILFIWGPHPVQMAQFHLCSICWRHDLEIAWTGGTDFSIKVSWPIQLWKSLKHSNCLRCFVHLDQRLALADWQIRWLAMSLLSLDHGFRYNLQTWAEKIVRS